ncbi:SARP family transcriptional regulator [Saccharothrix coeruleofusca]|uniref:SARP family transcriptional regulator n=1 Tax=Saccharothrix coeruleofusca TaxID=33919 RepID=A0A918EFL6_9PSEU|nr:SARP family transcriptional regulator [Saccharothrix coeruleofusca]
MAARAVRIRVFGSLRVWRGDVEVPVGPPARRAVLGLLVLARGEVVAQRELVDALWGQRSPRSAVNVLQTHVKHLRRLLEPDRAPRSSGGVLRHVGGGYALRPDALEIDLLRVGHLVARADEAHRDGDAAGVAAALGEALRLWHAPVLLDVPALAEHPEVVSLTAVRLELLARYCDAMIGTGAASDVLREVDRIAAEQPLDERAQARLIRAHHAAGQRARAFQVYREVRDRLLDELGVDPGPEILAAHRALLRDGQDTAPAAPAPRAELPVPKQLPPESLGFTGRADQLSTLDSLLPDHGRSGGAVTIAAISGTAGVGKTALAVHWAHRVRDRFPDGQLYANLRGHAHGTPAQPVEVLAQFLSALGVPAERVPLDPDTAAALYRTLMTDRKALVLLDDVAGPEQVRPLLPAGSGCVVVVTGRDSMAGLVAAHGARSLTLDVLSPDDAVELLGHVLGPQRVRAEQEAALQFAKLCAHLPLALRIAAANLAEHPGRGIEDHVAELREGNVLAALAVRGDEQTAVRTAFELSCAALPDQARRLFGMLSVVPGADFTAEAVAALADTDPAHAARLLDRLAAAHLVERHAPGRYRFHDLLRLYAAEQWERQESPARREAALRRLHDWYLVSVDHAARLLYPHMLRLPSSGGSSGGGVRPPAGVTTAAQASNWLDSERGNLVATIRHAASAGPEPVAWLLADALRGYFWMCTRRVEWLAAGEAGLAAAEAAGDPRARAATRLNLADLHFRQGRYRQAVRHHAHALLLARRAGWVEAQAAVLGNLGCVHWQAGRLAVAAARFERGLALSRAIGQPAGEAVALGNLGLVHWEMGGLARSAELYTLALERYRRIGSRYGEAINLTNLGRTQLALGRTAEGLALLTEALGLHREAGNRGVEAETRSLMAAAHRALDRPDEAMDHARAGLALARDSGDPRTEAEALVVLAAVHQARGERQDAVDHYQRALALIRDTGDRYPEVDALIGLASATARTDPARQALALAQRAGYRALAGLALGVLAEVLLEAGEQAQAAWHARRALAVHRETGHRPGERHARAVLRRAEP